MRYEKQCARKSTGGRAPSKQGLERPLSDSSDEEEEKEAVQRPESASGSSSDDEEVAEGEGEPTITDDEQDDKEIIAVPYPPGEQPSDASELKALIIQDLKTEDPHQTGGYARRMVARDSVVLVRGQEDNHQTVTWVALVDKIYRKHGTPWVDIRWFYRRADVAAAAAAEARRAALPSDPRQLVLTNDTWKTQAKFIRHPAQAWFLSPSTKPPMMRCGQGESRHTRQRPGFLVRWAFDKDKKRVYALGDTDIEQSPKLKREVMRLWTRSHAQLRRLEEEELAADAKQGWADVEAAPFLAPGAGAAAAEEEEEEAPVTPCASDSDSDDEGKAVLARARAQVARQKAEARRAEEAAAQRRKQQEDVDGFAAELARLLPQQTQQEEGAAGAAAQQQAADTAWRKPAQELLRQAGELPRRQAPPPGSQGSDVKLGEAEVRAMVARATLPGLAAMAPVLRAIGGATEAAARELFGDQGRFYRVLIAWLWRLSETNTPEAAECSELALRALLRVPYTWQVNRWIAMVKFGAFLARLQKGQRYPASVESAAAELTALWKRDLEALQAQRAERSRHKAEAAKAERERQRHDRSLLQQSPQASRAAELATSGRRLSALGSGGAMYVKPRASPQPASMQARAGASPAATKPKPAALLPSQQGLDRRPSLPPRPPAAPAAAAAPAGGTQVQHQQQQQQREQGAGSAAPAPAQRSQQERQPPAGAQQQQQQAAAKPAAAKPAAAKPAAAKPAAAKPAGRADGKQPPADLFAVWKNAFASGGGADPSSPRSPRKQLLHSTTAPQAALAAMAREQGAAGAAAGGAPHMGRSFSAPERDPARAAGAAAAAAAAEAEPGEQGAAGQKRSRPLSTDEALAAATAAKKPKPNHTNQPKKPAGKGGGKLQAMLKKAKR